MKNPALQFVRGGQIFLYTTKMMFQVIQRIFLWSLLGFVILFVGFLLYSSQNVLKILTVQYYSQFLSFVGLENKPVWSTLTAKQYLMVPKIQQAVVNCESLIVKNAISALIKSSLIYLIILAVFIKFFFRKGEKYSQDKHVSGTWLAKNAKELIYSVKNAERGMANIRLLKKIPLPQRSEYQGFFFHGSTGTGKSQAIMHLLDEIKRLGEPAIIYDKECTLKPYYFNAATDVELNPISTLCANWDLWEECANPMELSNVANFLIPKTKEGEDFWVSAARTIFSSMAWRIKKNPERSSLLLLRLLLVTSLQDMREVLQGTESEHMLSKDIAKTALSIKSVLATYTKSLRFLEGLDKQNKPKFSIIKWVADTVNNNSKSWLFISSRTKYHHEIKPLISLWIGLAMIGIQSLPENSGKRIWLIMDELASLHHLDRLAETLADIRKFGGCVAVGIQSIAQLDFLYGKDQAKAIADCLNTSFYFRNPTDSIAQWAARNLGEQVIEEVRESQSYGPNSIRDGNTISSQRIIRKTVEPSSILTLADLECYLKVLGNHPILKSKVPYCQRQKLVEPLVKREIDFEILYKLQQKAQLVQYDLNIDNDIKKIHKFEDTAHLVGEGLLPEDLPKSQEAKPMKNLDPNLALAEEIDLHDR